VVRATSLAVIACAFVAFAGCSGFDRGFEGTVLCGADSADVVFERSDRIEVRADQETLGWADAGGRGFSEDACAKVPTQTEWSVGIEYTKLERSATLHCRFPDLDSVDIHLHPVYTSEGGEDFPSGSALYVVLPESRTIVVSGSIVSRGAPGDLLYSKDYCTAD
jgi:hypothetical protein